MADSIMSPATRGTIPYIHKLANLLQQTNSILSTRDEDEQWQQLAGILSQNAEPLANDTYSKAPRYTEILQHSIQPIRDTIHGDISTRCRPKCAQRIVQKLEKGHFKTNSDLVAHRIEVIRPAGIFHVVQALAKGIGSVPGAIFQPRIPDFFKEEKPGDIIWFGYLYLPGPGYVSELQINQLFASYVFQQNSEKRGKPAEEERVDKLWELWGPVRTAMLEYSVGVPAGGGIQVTENFRMAYQDYFRWLEKRDHHKAEEERKIIGEWLKEWLLK